MSWAEPLPLNVIIDIKHTKISLEMPFSWKSTVLLYSQKLYKQSNCFINCLYVSELIMTILQMEGLQRNNIYRAVSFFQI